MRPTMETARSSRTYCAGFSRAIVLCASTVLLQFTGGVELLSPGAQAGTITAGSIPPALMRDVDAVVRMDSTSFTVDGPHSTNVRRRVVTVLNAAGRRFGKLYLRYDEFRKIESLEGHLYDATGKLIRSLEDEDLEDYAAIADHSLYEDTRVQTAELYHGTYPYTVVYDYEVSDDASISWPEWEPEFTRASVERTTFEVHLSGSDSLRWWTNAGLRPKITPARKGLTYRWEANHLQPIELEKVGPPDADQYARVKVAPRLIDVDGHEGDLSSWAGFGHWFHDLAVDRQTLSPGTIADVAALTAGVNDPEEKVRRLYGMLQSRTRYVNVALGIGGWQPFPASYVEERGYGDCKALTNYMHSLLKAAGIESFPALIYAGSEPRWLVREFPHNCFNHVILCVPLARDTIWLECTTQTGPFDHLGSSTENRYALVVTPKGGVLCRTPASVPADNCQLRSVTVRLTSEGDGVAEVRTRYTGDQQDRIRHRLDNAAPHERDTWLREDMDIPGGTLRQSDFSDVGKKQLHVDIAFTADLRRYGAPAGTRLLFAPNLMEKRTYIPPADTLRLQPIMESYPYLDIDTVTYILPAGFAMEALPKPVKLETPFASYSATTIQVQPREVRFVRRLEVRATELPPAVYPEYRAFWTDVVKADKAVAAMVKK